MGEKVVAYWLVQRGEVLEEVVVTRVVAVWLREGEGVTLEVWCVVLVSLAVPLCVWMIMVVVSVDVLDLLSVLVDVEFVVAMLDV